MTITQQIEDKLSGVYPLSQLQAWNFTQKAILYAIELNGRTSVTPYLPDALALYSQGVITIDFAHETGKSMAFKAEQETNE